MEVLRARFRWARLDILNVFLFFNLVFISNLFLWRLLGSTCPPPNNSGFEYTSGKNKCLSSCQH